MWCVRLLRIILRCYFIKFVFIKDFIMDMISLCFVSPVGLTLTVREGPRAWLKGLSYGAPCYADSRFAYDHALVGGGLDHARCFESTLRVVCSPVERFAGILYVWVMF